MELKVGMYVRDNDGAIGKVTSDKLAEYPFHSLIKIVDTDNENELIYLDSIVKSSFNIIDLIEEGDYVNGYKVIATYLSGINYYIKCKNLKGIRIYNEDIESIVTHEQFKSMEYRIGDTNE